MKYRGTIVVIRGRVQVTEKFCKREFIVTDKREKYPQEIQFEVQGNMCDVLDEFNTGALVDIEFDLKGNKWNAPNGEVKHFNVLKAWRVVRVRVEG